MRLIHIYNTIADTIHNSIKVNNNNISVTHNSKDYRYYMLNAFEDHFPNIQFRSTSRREIEKL
jgi:hypothetical protein